MSKPSLTDTELKAVAKVFETGWLGEGRETDAFEAALCDLTGAAHAVAVNTGTSAIHLTLETLGLEPDDEVILPAFTFASDPMAVLLCNARPIFADVDPNTLILDPDSVSTMISDKTRAVLPTDYAGLGCDTIELRQAIGNRGIKIIRDASHSFGSKLEGRIIGLNHQEDATCFSFDPIKNITCGEGGAILVRDGDWADTLVAKRRLGFTTSAWSGLETVNERVATMLGYRYHMGNLNAAIGLAQLGRLEYLTSSRQRVARMYDDAFREHPDVQCFRRSYEDVVPFLYPVLVDSRCRDELLRHLRDRGIHAGLRYIPCHHHPLFREEHRAPLPVTERLVRQLVCLPVHPGLTDDDVCEVIDSVSDFFRSTVSQRRVKEEDI